MSDYTIDKVEFFYKTIVDDSKRMHYLYASVDYSYGKQDHGTVVVGLKDSNDDLIYICETTLEDGVPTAIDMTSYEGMTYSIFEDQINDAVEEAISSNNVQRLEESHVKNFIGYLNFEMEGAPNNIYNERDPFEYLYEEEGN